MIFIEQFSRRPKEKKMYRSKKKTFCRRGFAENTLIFPSSIPRFHVFFSRDKLGKLENKCIDQDEVDHILHKLKVYEREW